MNRKKNRAAILWLAMVMAAASSASVSALVHTGGNAREQAGKRREEAPAGTMKEVTQSEAEEALTEAAESEAEEALTEAAESEAEEALTEAAESESEEAMPEFVLDEETGTLMAWNGDEEDVIVPSEIDGVTVRAVGYSAFERARTAGPDAEGQAERQTSIPAAGSGQSGPGLRSVELPETVMFIADGAFSDCRELETFVCKAPLPTTGRNAFKGCLSLKEARYEGGVKRIGSGCFEDTGALETVDFGEEPETMEENAFLHSGIKVLVLNCRYVARSAVNACENLEEIHITDRCESLAAGAVCDCSSLSVICYETNDLSFLPPEGAFSEPADEVTVFVPAVVPEENLDAVRRSIIWSPRQIQITVVPGGCERSERS